MNFFQLISNRESIRSYDPEKPVSHEVLLQILEAGRLAPSAANLQPWQFVVVSSPEMLAKVRATYSRVWFADAPHVLIVVGNNEKAWKRADGYNSIETDLTIAMDHMILAAESFGVVSGKALEILSFKDETKSSTIPGSSEMPVLSAMLPNTLLNAPAAPVSASIGLPANATSPIAAVSCKAP